ncbi:hypothetical protein [Arsukibacterium sp.]|uniref:hypothetical protein n=1 Tax=Arsukibacterium sp. TaxID=1977258 RepID=UPI002FD9EDED
MRYLLLLCLIHTSALKAETVRFFYSESPPFEQTSADGSAAGLGIIVVSNILTAAGLSPIFELYSIQRGVAALHREVHFTTVVSPTAEFKADFAVSQRPVYSISLGVVRLKHTPKLTHLSTLQPQSLVSLTETSFSYLLEKSDFSGVDFSNHYKVSTLEDALRLIQNKRYPYFLSYYLSEHELQSPFLVFDELLTLPVYLAMSKKQPDVTRLMHQVDQAMLNLDE